MRFAVSIISPPDYAHSQAFWEIAEAIHYALLDLGHDSVLTTRTTYPDRQHIILGSNLLPDYPIDVAPGSILYNLEQITPNSSWLNPALLRLFERYPLWDYSTQNIAQLRQLGLTNVEHMPVGYVPQLTRIARRDEDVDVLFIGSMNERRACVIEALRARGIRAEWAFGVYGAARDELIARARIVLNMHYYDAKVFEVVRVSYLLANGRFVISESGSCADEERAFSPGVVFCAYDDLVDCCAQYLARPDERAARAAAGFDLMTRRPQAAFLAPVIERLALTGEPATAVAWQHMGTAVPQSQAPFGQPRVSVIIPVYNRVELTASCLISLVETTAECGVEIELIVVDNGSTDDTRACVTTLIGGDVTVLRNEVNRGFGEACNQGATAARGEYLLFLNNDTLMRPNWLPPLVAALDEDPRLGAVQPRLVYPDGRLNDAGGLVFRGGQPWVYGKGAPVADAPPYATRRAPDYASGACLLVRRAAFEQVGGFDPRYAPAYYEDTDLSFALRAAGWSLLYEPASTVVHLEGGTAGTDVAVGLKQYQVVNQEKFARKWEADLRWRPTMDPSIVDAWAHRGQGGWGPGEDAASRGVAKPSRSVLFIDPFPPMWDRASGSLRLLHLLRASRQEGHAVAHVAAFRAPERRRYAAGLACFGVALYGVDPAEAPNDPVAQNSLGAVYLPDLATLLQRHRPDVVVFSPWTTAEIFLGPLRQVLPDTTIVVDTVDVHFVREQRTAELAGDAVMIAQAAANRARELAVYAAADRVVCVSEQDAAAIRQALPGCAIVIAGNAHDEVGIGPGFAERSGLLFVGNANHLPNVDAMEWWTREIAPRLAHRLPGVALTVIGNDPLGTMRAFSQQDVTALGWVPDTLPYLHAARVSVAPLRSGAGMKGKVGEALMAGLPVVGTPVAAEGMGLTDGRNVLLAHDAESFVEQVARLYTDAALWDLLREQGLRHARATLGQSTLRAAVAEIVAPAARRQPIPFPAAPIHAAQTSSQEQREPISWPPTHRRAERRHKSRSARRGARAGRR